MSGETNNFSALFNQEKLDSLFPLERSDLFFEALFGDASEGAYDIRLTYKEQSDAKLLFELELHQRPGKCLGCNLTYGLPNVFTRHPIIDIKGLVAQLDGLLGSQGQCRDWQLGKAREISHKLHVVPLIIEIDS